MSQVRRRDFAGIASGLVTLPVWRRAVANPPNRETVAILGARREPQTCDILILNALVITVNRQRQVLQNGAVAIRNGTIMWIGSDAEARNRYVGLETLDAQGAPVHPGFI